MMEDEDYAEGAVPADMMEDEDYEEGVVEKDVDDRDWEPGDMSAGSENFDEEEEEEEEEGEEETELDSGTVLLGLANDSSQEQSTSMVSPSLAAGGCIEGGNTAPASFLTCLSPLSPICEAEVVHDRLASITEVDHGGGGGGNFIPNRDRMSAAVPPLPHQEGLAAPDNDGSLDFNHIPSSIEKYRMIRERFISKDSLNT
eukprot:gnl/TRDRNA2_/TRDRNA2_163295_c0_seq3.p1 gnl/TRDRNA2_/TRDRNA2_163295_c0~~gnl/TRDRNA2_/TRDRNA2_163295_c0_seq3.p1  ORF type:complete len:200 (+),score=68.20 gnl/TRDRNA2_/TRDRNA2_163295_c0_seq3:2-601(+)